MNILKYSREEILRRVNEGEMRKENLKHYDLCRAIASGTTQSKAAEIFDLTDSRYVRRIKEKKCPDCGKGTK